MNSIHRCKYHLIIDKNFAPRIYAHKVDWGNIFNPHLPRKIP